MVLKPSKERKSKGRKASYQASRSLDDCVSATVSGLGLSRQLGLDEAPEASFGRLTTKAELGRPESDLDHVSSGFSTYLPQGKRREQRVRAQMVAHGYAPTEQDADWEEPQTQEPHAQSLAAAYDAYGEDEAESAAYDAYGWEDDEAYAPPVRNSPRRVSRKAERQAQTLSGLKTMGALLQEQVPAPQVEPAAVPEPPAAPERATPPVSFAQHDALEDAALRDLLGPAYDAAVGAKTLVASVPSEPVSEVPSAAQDDAVLRDLLGPAYDAAVGATTLVAAAPTEPASELPSAAQDDAALRELLGPAYDAAVGAQTLVAAASTEPVSEVPSAAQDDAALRDLLGPAYDAAVGATTLVAAAPTEPASEVPAAAQDDAALRDLLGPAYDAAVGREPALAPPAAVQPTGARLAPGPKARAAQPVLALGPKAPASGTVGAAAYLVPPLDGYEWAPPVPPADWAPPPLPDEAYAAYDAPPWAGDEPSLPEAVPPLGTDEAWTHPGAWAEDAQPPRLAAHEGARRRDTRRVAARGAQARPEAAGARADSQRNKATGALRAQTTEHAVPYVKDLDEVSSSVGLNPYDDEAQRGRRGARRGPEVKDLEGSASTVSLPYEQNLSGYSIELDATGAGADARAHGKRRSSHYRRGRQGQSLEELSSSVTLPVGTQIAGDPAADDPEALRTQRRRRSVRGPKAPQVSSLDELSSSVTLPRGARLEPEVDLGAGAAAVSAPSAAGAPSAQGAPSAAAQAGGSDEVTQAYNEMIRLLTAREYSAHELTRKCTGCFAAAAVTAALERCQAQGLQSDERYADLLVRHMRLALYGSYKLRLEAQRKGVAWHLVEAAVAANELDWSELAYECLRKKYTPADLADYKTRVKANGYLGRRGFETAEREYALKRLARGE